MNSHNLEFESPDETLDLEPDVIENANSGNAFVQLDIGKAFHSESNLAGNCEKAFNWFMLSAEQNNMEAQFRLGDLYASGQGIEKDEFKAYDWYLESALQGYPKALTRIHNLIHIEKGMHCRGQKDSTEKDWASAEFKKDHHVRELNEYRVEQLSGKLTKIKEYFSNLLTTCREKLKDEKQDKQRAYLVLGFLYQHGYGVRKIISRAIEFYTLAAEKGSIDAAFNLGHIYHHHTDLKWNYREAFKWYTMAAQNRSSCAQNGLAFLYLKGLATNIDYTKALDLYRLSAESRNVNAMLSLASIFRKGEIVKENHELAIEWYKKAIKEGSTVAQNSLEKLYHNRIDMLSTENREVTHDKAVAKVFSKKRLCSRLDSDISHLTQSSDLETLKERASKAMRGDGHAMLDIGMKYYHGVIFPRDKDVASKWIKNAAKAKLNEARRFIAKMYHDGDWVDQDYHKASIWYMKAAKNKDAIAQHQLGLMYQHGLGVRKDPLEASKWFTFSSDRNNSDARCLLGILRETGEGLRQDIPDALRYFKDAVKLKNPQAVYQLAKLYESGSVKESSPELAINLFEKAARLGSLDAQLKLAKRLDYGGTEEFNPKSAFKYYSVASNKGSPEGKYRLAILYLDGQGVEQDLIKAYHLFKEFSDLGFDAATNLFRVPIDYSKNRDIDYYKITTMFESVCKNRIDSIEYNLGCHYGQDTTFFHKNIIGSITRNRAQEKTWHKLAANKGHVQAQYKLGVFYEKENKDMNEQDLSKSLGYFKEAYAGGSADAAYKLALIYLAGYGLSQDLEKAFNLFNRASDMGHDEAYKTMNELKGDARDEKANNVKRMLAVSANSGNVISQYKLGKLTVGNKPIHQNSQDAKKWFELASVGGFISASYKLGVLLEEEATSEEDYQEIIRLYQSAGDKGHEEALFKLAQLHHIGTKIKTDYMEAFRYYTLAAQQGYEPAKVAINVTIESIWKDSRNQTKDAIKASNFTYESCFEMWKYVANKGNVELQYKLGTIYEESGTDYTLSHAANWYSRAAENSHNLALYRLGRLYEMGRGVIQEYKKAIKYYEIASDLGNIQALYQLGTLYHHGRGVPQDFETAVNYYRNAAERNYSKTQLTLGQIFEEGILLPQNILEAIKWHSLSDSQGNEDAKNRLSTHYDEAYTSLCFYHRKFNILTRIINQNRKIDSLNNTMLGPASYKLGHMYCYGYGTSINYNKALEHFRMSAKLCYEEDICFFSTLVYENIKSTLTEKYLKKLEMFEAAVEQLTIEDLYELGSIYYHGVYSISEANEASNSQIIIKSDNNKSSMYFKMIIRNETPDGHVYRNTSFCLGMIYLVDMEETCKTEKTHYYFTKALNGGCSDADIFLQYINKAAVDKEMIYKKIFEWHMENEDPNNFKITYNIGWIYYKGIGTEQDYTKALDYFKAAANKNYKDAEFMLGCMYSDGNGTDLNYAEAFQRYTNAANQGHIAAIFNLGEMYFNGRNIKKNYKRAIHYYTIAAYQNNSDAQCMLGNMYENGYGVDQDYNTAMKWYSKAANQKHILGCRCMGLGYYNGKGVKKNYNAAFYYFTVAADKGDAESQNKLGIIYDQGYGIDQDYTKAIEWYSKAANQNVIEANYNLGSIYSDGQGVEKDYTKAFEYYKSAADQGDSDAQFQLGYFYENGYSVNQDYTKAIEWYSKAANQNGIEANYNLGSIYSNGRGVEKDYTKAFEYYKSAANQGYGDAQFQLGYFYENGYSVNQDYTKAIEWYSKAANQNGIGANYNLGSIYSDGRGVERDDKKAFEYYKYAADHGDSDAQLQLGYFYSTGCGVDQDDTKAIEWYSRAASQNDIVANYNLGVIYSDGRGVEKDDTKAFEYYKCAADHGDSDAQSKLAYMYNRGLGVEKNPGEAIAYYSKSSIENKDVLITLGEIYHSTDDKYRNFSKAFECYLDCPDNDGKSYGLRGLGLLYEHGDGVEKSYEKALDYYQQSAEMKNKGSYYNTALLYYYGKGVVQDFSISLEWFGRVINEVLSEGCMYVLVQVEHDPESGLLLEDQKSYSLVSETIILGEAHFYLGMMHKLGQGTPKDNESSLNHFKIVQSYGIEKAQEYLDSDSIVS